MNIKYPMILLSVISCSVLLSACSLVEESNASDAGNAAPAVVNLNNYYQAQNTMLYPRAEHYSEVQHTPKKVTVPDSYHLTAAHGPLASREIDKSWVDKQNPQEYTIELSNNEKASSVANVLQQTPKKERTAEIKSMQDGKTVYHGVYGSYKDKESAEKALNNLPEKVKQQANIQQWNHLQDKTLEKSSIPSANNNTNNNSNNAGNS